MTIVIPDQARLIDAVTECVIEGKEIRDLSAAWAELMVQYGARRIALQADSTVEWALIDLACLQAGIVLAPIPTYLSEQQQRAVIGSLQPDVWISDIPRDDLERLALVRGMHVYRHPSDADTQVPPGCQKITFTSGSTGSPKGVCLTARAQLDVANDLVERVRGFCPGTPRHLCLLPLPTLLENIAGILAPLMAGGEVIIAPDALRGFSGSRLTDPMRLLALVSKWQPGSLIVVPELLKGLLMACRMGWTPPSSLSFIAVGGARVSEELLRQAARAGLPVYQGYGLSECASVVALSTQAPDGANDSVGVALPHRRVRIEDGELIVETPFLGYLGDPGSASDEVRTGDLAEWMQDGSVRIIGRRKNLIITSFGRNVSPEWVETALTDTGVIQQSMLTGDARPFCSALIVAPAHVSDTDISSAIASVNAKLPDYARVIRHVRLPEPFTALNGLLTVNGRLRRDAIAARHADIIDSLYEGEQDELLSIPA